jgi:hypothetical protein
MSIEIENNFNFVLGQPININNKNNDYKQFHCKHLDEINEGNIILLITNNQIIEINNDIIVKINNLSDIKKLKFSKGNKGIIDIYYSDANEVRYYINEPTICMDYIKIKMSTIGIKGKTIIPSSNISKKKLKKIQTAQAFYDTTILLQNKFNIRPKFEYIIEIMDLMREACERFSAANDPRYIVVIKQIQKFLQKPIVVQILDECKNYKKNIEIESTPSIFSSKSWCVNNNNILHEKDYYVNEISQNHENIGLNVKKCEDLLNFDDGVLVEKPIMDNVIVKDKEDIEELVNMFDIMKNEFDLVLSSLNNDSNTNNQNEGEDNDNDDSENSNKDSDVIMKELEELIEKNEIYLKSF